MTARLAFVAAASAAATLLAATSALPAGANPIRHAGEWQTVIDGGTPRVACVAQDQTLAQVAIARVRTRRPGASCKTPRFVAEGDTVNYALECTFRGSLITTSGTLTETGPDSFTSTDHSHGGALPLPAGRSMPMPDSDTVAVLTRLGPCKPGDSQ